MELWKYPQGCSICPFSITRPPRSYVTYNIWSVPHTQLVSSLTCKLGTKSSLSMAVVVSPDSPMLPMSMEVGCTSRLKSPGCVGILAPTIEVTCNLNEWCLKNLNHLFYPWEWDKRKTLGWMNERPTAWLTEWMKFNNAWNWDHTFIHLMCTRNSCFAQDRVNI